MNAKNMPISITESLNKEDYNKQINESYLYSQNGNHGIDHMCGGNIKDKAKVAGKIEENNNNQSQEIVNNQTIHNHPKNDSKIKVDYENEYEKIHIEANDIETLKMCFDFLAKRYDSPVKIKDIEKGSIKFILEGSEEGLKRIVDSFESGELAPLLKQQFNLELEDAKLMESDSSKDDKKNQKILAFTIAGNASQSDIKILKAAFIDTSDNDKEVIKEENYTVFNADDGKEREKKLKKLFQQLHKQNCSQKHQEYLVERIAKLVLHSRTFCRKYQGQPLFGIYQEIYAQVKLHLIEDIISENSSCQLSELGTVTWQKKVKIKAFRKVLTDDKLKQLALTVQGFTPNSGLRSYALQELIRAIKISGKLCRPYQYRFSPEIYQVIYEEALMETFMYICTKIDNYDPERGKKKFMNWVNFKLNKSFLLCVNQLKRNQELQFFESSSWEQITAPVNSPSSTESLLESLLEYIKKDPEELFIQSYIKGRPDANFRTIVLARIAGQSWQEIAQEFDISVSTVSSFYRRNCKRFKSILELCATQKDVSPSKMDKKTLTVKVTDLEKENQELQFSELIDKKTSEIKVTDLEKENQEKYKLAVILTEGITRDLCMV